METDISAESQDITDQVTKDQSDKRDQCTGINGYHQRNVYPGKSLSFPWHGPCYETGGGDGRIRAWKENLKSAAGESADCR